MNAPVAPPRPALALFAKAVVLAVFALIFIGGLVTSWQAGMAVPDWPLSFGSINPAGWWNDFPVRLEHGHRLIASVVGLLTMLLCAWVWRHRGLVITALVAAFGLALSIALGTHHESRSPEAALRASFWVAGIMLALLAIFAAVLLRTSRPAPPGERPARTLAFLAFIAVCLQAILGGLRVTQQTAGALDLALVLRIFHGCVAQAFLCLVVATAALLSPAWNSPSSASAVGRGLRTLSWITTGTIYLQLIIGAAMRHLGAGLAIPTFPAAGPNGSPLPAVHNVYTDTNFTHTRFGALIVTALLVTLAVRVLVQARGVPRLNRPAATLLALLAVQLTLGVIVVLYTKPPTLTTFHVLNGAALLATSFLLSLRLGQAASIAREPSEGAPSLLSNPSLS